MSMIATVMGQVTSRFLEVNLLLNELKTIENDSIDGRRSESIFRISKGLFLVHLYGAYEFAVNACVLAVMETLDAQGVSPARCRPQILAILLHSEFQSVADSGRRKKWSNRLRLLQSAASLEKRSIIHTALLEDLQNARFNTIEMIWGLFCIDEPISLRNIGLTRTRINELVEKRNDIAHGKISPSSAAQQLTVKDLRDRFDDIKEWCMYMIHVFTRYLDSKRYLNPIDYDQHVAELIHQRLMGMP